MNIVSAYPPPILLPYDLTSNDQSTTMNRTILIERWIAESAIKLSVRDVCDKFIDIDGDPRSSFFWNIRLKETVIITPEVLEWCGYRGNRYLQIHNFLKFMRSRRVRYTTTSNNDIVVDAWDFEMLLPQMRTPRSMEIIALLVTIKHILLLYMEYEREYDKRILGPRVVSDVVESAPKTNRHKRFSALYETGRRGEWRIMQRQNHSWKKAETRLFRLGMRLIKKWENPRRPSVDVGRAIHMRDNRFTWIPRNSTVVSSSHVIPSSDELVDLIASILDTAV